MTFPPVNALCVPCPVCEAPAGEQCRYLATLARVYNIRGAERASLAARAFPWPRAPHRERKMIAAVAAARAALAAERREGETSNDPAVHRLAIFPPLVRRKRR